MRYPQGGGLTDERRAFRERIYMEAVGMFVAGQGNTVVAKQLRVSVRSVQRWRRSWLHGGSQALCSRGSAARPKLSDALFAVLEQELTKGPLAHGWPARPGPGENQDMSCFDVATDRVTVREAKRARLPGCSSRCLSLNYVDSASYGLPNRNGPLPPFRLGSSRVSGGCSPRWR